MDQFVMTSERADVWPQSLWVQTAVPAPATEVLTREIAVNVAIVGGGYTGLSSALHLAQRGVKVALVEASGIGWGASGRNGGQVVAGLKWSPKDIEMLFPGALAERLIQISTDTPDIVFDLIEKYKIECDPVRAGWIEAVHNSGARKRIEALAKDWETRGIPVRFLDRKATADLIGSDIYFGALLDPRCGKLQPLSYARGLAGAALQEGASLYTQSPALGLGRQNGKWHVRTSRGRIAADWVVVATNGYTGNLIPRLRRGIIAATSCQIATEPLSAELLKSILPNGQGASDSRRILTYFRTDASGRVLLGGRGKFDNPGADSAYKGVQKSIGKIFPQLKSVKITHRWFGRIALTLDQIPHITEHDTNLLVPMGYNGRGIAMSTCFGRIIADRITQGESRSDPLFSSPLKPIPMHALRRLWIAGASAYYRTLDSIG